MAKPHHLLVLRFSSLGDVAMTVPVIASIDSWLASPILTAFGRAS